ncbi:hypothetical protein HY772_05695 [Candidatus Woesearchaeota archaeon]|nr:hypothetical protein [Candidatus Woesearchaeota archaeon]
MKSVRALRGVSDNLVVVLIALFGVLLLVNQYYLSSVVAVLGSPSKFTTGSAVSFLSFKSKGGDLTDVDLSAIKSTGHSVAAVFPVDKIKTQQDAVDIMIPSGTPAYGAQLGVSFDDPVPSLARLAQIFTEVQMTPEQNQRWLNLVLKPVGISCEYCCGVGPIGATSDGRSKCGCQHNPALLGLSKWLVVNTDMNDAEVLRETLRWKALFFPKNMVELAMQVAGGDTSKLENLPGMVGGC